MSQIILDFGSGNTCKNDPFYTKKMIDELKKVDTGKHEIVIKWQLFKKAGENVPLNREVFKNAYDYAKKLGYQTTSSVFDKESLDFLLQFDIPFVKIANNRELDWLIDFVPRGILVYLSLTHGQYEEDDQCVFINNHGQYKEVFNTKILGCVSDYPAKEESYKGLTGFDGISDHTIDWKLFYCFMQKHHETAKKLTSDHKKQQEYLSRLLKDKVWEVHYKLPDSTGLDAGDFARTPEQLAEVL